MFITKLFEPKKRKLEKQNGKIKELNQTSLVSIEKSKEAIRELIKRKPKSLAEIKKIFNRIDKIKFHVKVNHSVEALNYWFSQYCVRKLCSCFISIS